MSGLKIGDTTPAQKKQFELMVEQARDEGLLFPYTHDRQEIGRAVTAIFLDRQLGCLNMRLENIEEQLKLLRETIHHRST